VLRQVADLLPEGLPAGGFCARYGGEEFVLVLPDVDATTAIRIAEEARARIARHPWSQLRLGLRVTVGVGLAHETFSPEGRPDAGRGFEAERQLVRADKLLYAAKRAGRNLVAYGDRETIQIVEHRK
jgi:diguanylate cyclase (GGDEF)-like protein